MPGVPPDRPDAVWILLGMGRSPEQGTNDELTAAWMPLSHVPAKTPRPPGNGEGRISSTHGKFVWYDAMTTDTKTAAGGQVNHGPMQVPGGIWIVRCADAQDAMFAMVAGQR